MSAVAEFTVPTEEFVFGSMLDRGGRTPVRSGETEGAVIVAFRSDHVARTVRSPERPTGHGRFSTMTADRGETTRC